MKMIKISFDTILINDDNTISINIKVDEGEKYFFGNVFWIGNKIYSNDELSKRLSIKSGDIYNQTLLEEKLFGNANGDDISSLYLDDGYLFFNASPSEIVKENNYIDLNIKLYEGDKAKVNKVNVIGNSKTNDQKRILTPKLAYKNGSDWLVIGRPLTKGNIKKIWKDL